MILLSIDPSFHSIFISNNEISTQIIHSPKLNQDPNSFFSEWDTTLVSSGSSNNDQIRLPLQEDGIYNFTIDWGDETTVDHIQDYNQTEVTHTYNNPGQYNLTINGTIIGWRFGNSGDRLKLLKIYQWGCLALGHEETERQNDYFSGCQYMEILATDPLNVSDISSLTTAFYNCHLLGNKGDINCWDVSHIKDMTYMFTNAYNFNMSLADWNVSSVTSMSNMFESAEDFNQPIGNWNVSSVISMTGMFHTATSFNQDIGGWDTSSVEQMNWMFAHCTGYNQSLSGWDVSEVLDMNHLFYYAEAFNQDIGDWNTSSVTDMSYLFYSAVNFNQDIGGWNTSSVTDMNYMFYELSDFNCDLDKWDVSAVTNMYQMFGFASSFNGNISTWDVSSVTSMQSMFDHASAFNQPIGDWNVGQVLSMRRMFNYAEAFNQDINSWDVSKCILMDYMFCTATSFNQDLDKWDVSNVITMYGMFVVAEEFNGNISTWDVSSVTNMRDMFRFAETFNQDISSWDVSSVTTMQQMFYYAGSFNQDISKWDTSAVSTMRQMFYQATSFNQSLSDWDVSAVTNMEYMFFHVSNFNSNLSNWNVSSVTNMVGMFNEATSFNQDISNWDVAAVTDMRYMFSGATSFNQKIGNWNVSAVTQMDQMLTGVFLSIENYDQLLLGWADLPLQTGVTFTASGCQYSIYAESARTRIINDFSWTIVDAGLLDNASSPQSLTIEVNTSSLILEWLPPTDHVIEQITGYNIYRSLISGTDYSYLSSTSDLTYNDSDIEDNVKYYYVISAENYNGESFYSNEVNGVITPPIVISSEDICYKAGEIGNEINWHLNDTHPDIYKIYRNGELLVDSTAWTNDTISLIVDGLSIGEHIYQIFVYDFYGTLTTASIVVTVYEASPPVINQPPDIEYTVGDLGNKIVWVVNDTNPGTYVVKRNGTVILDSVSWINGTIEVILDGLSEGVYNFSIEVFDLYNNTSYDTVIVTVLSVPDETNTETSSTETTSSTTDSTQTTSERNPSNFPLIFGGISGTVLVSGVLLFLVVKKKKK